MSDAASDVFKILELFYEESDRASAILIASHLDSFLEDLFKAYFVDNNEEIFKGFGPLSSYRAKIEIAYQLGFISNRLRSDLNLTRKIRNEFAHSVGKLSFDMSPISDWIFEINKSIGFQTLEAYKDRPSPIKQMYAIDSAFIMTHIVRLIELCNKKHEFDEEKEFYGYLKKGDPEVYAVAKKYNALREKKYKIKF